MEHKFEHLTIMDAYIFGKVVKNSKIAKRFMEKLIGKRIHHVVSPKQNSVYRKDGLQGICVEVHMADEQRTVQMVQIYLCAEDIFGHKKGVYRFVSKCEELPELILKECRQEIFVCATVEPENTTLGEDIKAFLEYMKNPKIQRNNLVKMLDDEVRRIKTNALYKKEYAALQREKTERQQRDFAQAYKKRNS